MGCILPGTVIREQQARTVLQSRKKGREEEKERLLKSLKENKEAIKIIAEILESRTAEEKVLTRNLDGMDG